MIKAVQESVGLDITERIIATSNDSKIQALKNCIVEIAYFSLTAKYWNIRLQMDFFLCG